HTGSLAAMIIQAGEGAAERLAGQRSTIERMLIDAAGRLDHVARETLAASERTETVLRGEAQALPAAVTEAAMPAEQVGRRLHESGAALVEQSEQTARQAEAANAALIGQAQALANVAGEALTRLREFSAGFANQAEAVIAAARQGGSHIDQA